MCLIQSFILVVHVYLDDMWLGAVRCVCVNRNLKDMFSNKIGLHMITIPHSTINIYFLFFIFGGGAMQPLNDHENLLFDNE